MRTLLAILGFALVIIGTYCPLLNPFGILNWNLYALNKPYGIVVFVVAVGGIIAIGTRLRKAIAWAVFILITMVFIAAVMKVHTSFSFIPFKTITSWLAARIHFKWGWFVLFAGAIIALFGSYGKSVARPAFRAAKQPGSKF